jgi:hypothetical protein
MSRRIEMSKMFVVWIMLAALVGGARSKAQDLEAALEDWPLVSAALLRVLEGSPPFVARAEVEVKYQTDAIATKALGICAWQKKNLRWDISLSQLRGPLLSPQVVGAVNQLRIGPVIVLAREDQKRATLLFSGAKAHLEAKIPHPDRDYNRPRMVLAHEMLEKQSCSREKFSWSFGKRKTDLVVWKSQDAPHLPLQVRIRLDNSTMLVRFREARELALGANRFLVPVGSTKYEDFADLMQSLLWQRLKSRLGWQTPK